MKNKTASCFQAGRNYFTRSIKALIVLILFCWSGQTAFSQDLLIMKSGKELKVIIIEETGTVVRYREYENPTGPLYSVAKDKVASVKYKKGQPQQTGKQETVNPAVVALPAGAAGLQQLTARKRNVYLDGKALPAKTVKTMMEDYPEALKYYESGKRNYKFVNSCAFGVIFTSLISSAVANGKEDEDAAQKIRYIGLAIDGGFIISALVMASMGKNNIKKSVTLYNDAVNKPVSFKLDFGLQENGIGIALRF
jgi:hypothetical protein